MYFATVVSATSCPSTFSSDAIRGAPQSTFSFESRLMRNTRLHPMAGRPIFFGFDFLRQ